jgi:hypothetical protein
MPGANCEVLEREEMSRTQRLILIISGILAVGCAVTNIAFDTRGRYEDYFKALRTISFVVFVMSLIRLHEKRKRAS